MRERSDEGRRRNGTAVRRRTSPVGDQLVAHDAEVVERDIGELGTAIDVAERPHAIGRGPQVLVDDDRLVGDRDTGRLEAEPRWWSSSEGGEDEVGLERRVPSSVVVRWTTAADPVSEVVDGGLEDDVDARVG